MRLCAALILLSCLLGLSAGQQMNVWADSIGASPVYYAQTSFTDTNNAMGDNRFQKLYDFAQAHFDTLNGRSDVKTQDGTFLVAALWDPISSAIYLSTIPRGGAFLNFMTTVGASRAPVWFARASDITPKRSYHAEDGAYFAMEYLTQRYKDPSEDPSKDPDTAMNTLYASGSKVVVWGYYGSDEDDVKTTGRRIGLCTGRDTNKPRNPSCTVLAGRLGVALDPNADDPYPAGLDDADLLAACDNIVLTPQDPPPPPAPAPAQKRSWLPRGSKINKLREINARQDTSAAVPVTTEVPAQVTSAITSADGISLPVCTGSISTFTVTASYNPTSLTVTLPPDSETGIDTATGTVIATLTAPASVTAPATSAVITTFQTAISTAATGFSCHYQGDDPDEGVTSAYCVCSQGTSIATAALPRNSAGDAIPSGTNSCPYTAWPGTVAITPTTTLGPASTNIMACQVCSPAVVNEDACTSIPNCTPQFPVATVSIGSSPVNVGTLTGSALYTSVSSALESLCPSVTQNTALTQCSGTATIPDIAYAADDDLATDGELLVTADLSGYNSTVLRDALISSLAASAQQAATGSNCYVPEGSAGLGEAAPDPSDTFCNSAWFYEADYFNPWWREAATPGPTDFIHATIEFHTAPNSLDFLCDFIDMAIDALAVVEPEFAIEDLELEEGINFICENADGEQSEGSTAGASD